MAPSLAKPLAIDPPSPLHPAAQALVEGALTNDDDEWGDDDNWRSVTEEKVNAKAEKKIDA
jgi:hypothetical protein